MESIVTASCFGVLALAHSALGELELLRPLFARQWDLGIPRVAAERIFRFAWHLTSLAWLGLGALALGVSLWLALAAIALVSGLVIFVMLRGHLAWPIFFAAALAAALAGDLVGARTLAAVSVTAALALALAGALHLRWAAGGGPRMATAVIPTRPDGTPQFRPPWWLTVAVGMALLGAATLLLARTLGGSLPGLELGLVLITIVFTLRAAGDGRHVGFFKPRHESNFERLDDRFYTPLSVLFAFGGAAALLL